jgi:hypothetical protein
MRAAIRRLNQNVSRYEIATTKHDRTALTVASTACSMVVDTMTASFGTGVPRKDAKIDELAGGPSAVDAGHATVHASTVGALMRVAVGRESEKLGCVNHLHMTAGKRFRTPVWAPHAKQPRPQ